MKLAEFLTSSRQSEKIFRTLRKVHKLRNLFKIIMKLAEFFTSSRQPEKIFRTLRKV